MSQSFNPDELDITKDEVVQYLKLIHIRMKNNPRVSFKVRGKFAADIKLVEMFASEEEMRYHVSLALEIADGIRSIIARKKAPELQKLNEMHREAVIKKIVTPPEIVSELDHMKIMAQVRKVIGFGGMAQDG